MSNIALALDKKERELMAEGGVGNEDFLKYMQVSNFMSFTLKNLARIIKCGR